MRVCDRCAKSGKVLFREAEVVVSKPTHRTVEKEIDLVDDYAQRIKSAREKKGLSRKEFALAINEREPHLRHIESGEMIPDESLARRMEHALGIRLLEEVEIDSTKLSKQKSAGTTLGDIVELLKKKPKK